MHGEKSKLQDAISQKILRQIKNTGSNVAIEMTSLRPPASYRRRISTGRDRGGGRGGAKRKVGFFRRRSQAGNPRSTFNIPYPGGVVMLPGREARRGEARGGEASA